MSVKQASTHFSIWIFFFYPIQIDSSFILSVRYLVYIFRSPWRDGILATIRRTSATNSAPIAENGLIVSDSCAQRLKELATDSEEACLRVTVEGGGCSGFQYKFDLDSTINEDDR